MNIKWKLLGIKAWFKKQTRFSYKFEFESQSAKTQRGATLYVFRDWRDTPSRLDFRFAFCPLLQSAHSLRFAFLLFVSLNLNSKVVSCQDICGIGICGFVILSSMLLFLQTRCTAFTDVLFTSISE